MPNVGAWQGAYTSHSRNMQLLRRMRYSFFFFFNDTATTEIYTLSLHDALPISLALCGGGHARRHRRARGTGDQRGAGDRKSTRLNSSHSQISYAVFCLKKKKQTREHSTTPTSRQAMHTLTLHDEPSSLPLHRCS